MRLSSTLLAAVVAWAGGAGAAANPSNVEKNLAPTPDPDPAPGPALRLTFSKCAKFTDAAGKQLPASKMFLSCVEEDLHAPRQSVGGDEEAVFSFDALPDFVHCRTYTAATGNVGAGPYAKWYVLGKALRARDAMPAHFQDDSAPKRMGECSVRVEMGGGGGGGGGGADAGQKHVFARVASVEGVNEMAAAAHTKDPFVEAKYAGKTAGMLRASPGATFDLGPVVADRKASVFFDMLDGPLKQLSFSAVELDPAQLGGQERSYTLRSHAGEKGAVLGIDWNVIAPAEFAARKREVEDVQSAGKEVEGGTKPAPKDDDDTPPVSSSPKPPATA